MIELFRRFPKLARHVPHIQLGSWPTPVTRMPGLEQGCAIYIKNDGSCAPLYGGNKVRKLEFLLAEAIRRGCREVLTFGVAGSNHALATALYAEQQGLYQSRLTVAIAACNGTLTIRSLEPGKYTPEHLDVLRQAVAQISPGIANAIMFQSSERRLRERTVLADIGLAATSTADPFRIIELRR